MISAIVPGKLEKYMTVFDRWLLPDGVDELLPEQAWSLELLKRRMLDAVQLWGYELISPPLVEFLDSLLTGTGNDLNLQTFKVTDQLSGRLMGVRADMTPQAARIDAHSMPSKGITRLCYADSVLHTRPAHMLTNRCPEQFGCELFGDASQMSDIEIISLMIETLKLAGVENIHIDLAHVGIYRGLVSQADISEETERQLFDMLRRKSIPELETLLVDLPTDVRNSLLAMANIAGGRSALEQMQVALEGRGDNVQSSLNELRAIADAIAERYPEVELCFDFCELRGYNYHTGLVFAAYTPGFGSALAQGGRYDCVGADFGQARPATGFSADLKNLLRWYVPQARNVAKLAAPMINDMSLELFVADLRRHGECVVRLPESDLASADTASGFSGVVVKKDEEWSVRPL